jgi:hypothetical protein
MANLLLTKISLWNLVLLRSFVAVMLLATLSQLSVWSQTSVPAPSTRAAEYGKLPLSFEANQGQSDPQVKFLSRGDGYSLFLTDTSAVLTLSNGTGRTGMIAPASRNRHGELPEKNATSIAPQDVLRMEVVGAARGVSVQGAQILPGTANYFIGNDPAKWHTGVPTYARIKYAQVYPGVDLIYYGNQRQLEYDFVIAPHADTRQVRLRFAGVNRVLLSANGDLKLIGKHGEMAFRKPVVYQLLDGKRKPVDGSFKLMAKNEVGFALGGYDAGRELVIDPTLSYSTYLGGNGTYAGDSGNAIAVDAAGNAYVTGSTGSTNFPTVNPYQKSLKGPGSNVTVQNAFVTKINPTGTALVYSTYLGGSDNYRFGDAGRGIAVDATGAAYVTGTTGSTDFPITSNAYQKTNKTVAASGSYTGFVTKFSPAGNTLVYSTFLGGSGIVDCCNVPYGDTAQAIALGPYGNAFIGGYTSSKDFPVLNAYQKKNNSTVLDYYGQKAGYNAFVSELNTSGSALVYSTYLGGTGDDAASGIAVDGQGSVYLVGSAGSKDFPVSSDAFQKKNNSTSAYALTNVFVSKLSAGGGNLVYSTYLGGSNEFTLGDMGRAIAVDPECYAYVTGSTPSLDFPTTKGSLEPTVQGQIYSLSAFVTKLNTTGSALVYSTYLGGGSTVPSSEGDFGFGIQVDASGNAYVTGSSQSTSIPITANAYQKANKQTGASGDAFLTELNEAGSGVIYSSYLGGSGTNGKGDAASAVALDAAGNAYITGSTYSQDFPVTSGAYQPKSAGTVNQNGITANAFVAKFGIGSGEVLSATTVSITPDANPAAADEKITFTAYVAQGTTCGFPPTGTVSFTIDGKTPIKVTLDDTGHATYFTSTLTVAKHTVSASYSGDMRYKPSTSATLTETVTGAPTSVAPASGGGQTAVYGSVYAKPLVVIVKDAAGGAAPGVPVVFSGTGLKFAPTTVMTNESGVASTTVTAAGTGSLIAEASVNVIATVAKFALTGTKAVLTVTATSVRVPYDQPIPLKYTITGYVNADTSKVVTGAPTETTTAKQGSAVGTYPITLGMGNLAATNYTFKLVNGTVTITSLGTAKTPTFSPATGSYTGAQSVTLADATSGAVIYYTTNGSTPTASSTKYTKAIAVSATETIKAIAVASGYVTSPVASATYTIEAATPVFSPVAGTYSAARSVKITDATAGAVIYYTTNGSTPTTSSTKYTAAIAVSATETIKAIAVASGHATSPVASATYTIE